MQTQHPKLLEYYELSSCCTKLGIITFDYVFAKEKTSIVQELFVIPIRDLRSTKSGSMFFQILS